MRGVPTPSMGVACLALAVSLSGTAYAVTRLPANSVGTRQVINGSLQEADLKPGTLPQAGRAPKLREVVATSTFTIGSTGAEEVTAKCPPTDVVLGGGWKLSTREATVIDAHRVVAQVIEGWVVRAAPVQGTRIHPYGRRLLLAEVA